MSNLKKAELRIKILLFIICAILFTYNLGSALPIIESEKFYYQSVKEMFARHDWVTPYYQGRFRFQKPILFYWIVSLSYSALGINNFAVRLPSALFGALTVLLTFNIGRKLFDRKTGFLAAGLLATFAIFFMYSRYASPDMALTFFITWAMYLFIKGSKSVVLERRFFKYFFIVLGLATLNKGYVGFLIPFIIVFSYIASTRKWRLAGSMNFPFGIFIIILIALPWYILMMVLHGEKYLDHILLVETVKRLFYAPNNEMGMAFWASYFKRFLYYIPILIGWFAPHSLFLPGALTDTFRSKDTYSREKDSYKFVLCYFLSIFVFFTLVSVKEYHYMLPIAPAYALIIARYLVNLNDKKVQFKSRNFNFFYLSITVLYIIGISGIVYTMRHIYPERVASYEYLILLSPLILVVPYLKRSANGTLIALPVAMAILMAFLGGRAIPLLNDNAMRKFAQDISEGLREEDRVGVGSVNISQQRLSIYLDRRIEEVNIKWKDPRAVPIHMQRIRDFFSSGDSVYLIISREDYERLVPEEVKNRVDVLGKRKTWKTRLKRSFTRKVILDILRGRKDILKDVLRHEVYLITNKDI